MRRGHAGKVDANQKAIVEALRLAGCSVQSIASVGKGCPDLMVGKYGRTWLIEVKRPKAKLTPDEVVWRVNWHGHLAVVTSPEEALQVIR